MATMRPLRAFSLLGITSAFSVSACRLSPLLAQRDAPRSQCSPYSTYAAGDSFLFKLAASYSGKDQRYNAKRDTFIFDPQTEPVTINPKQRFERPNSGQDAFFISSIGNTSDVAFGVADGVGGWIESGIDPSDFSHGLCEHMRKASRETPPGKELQLRPVSLMRQAYDHVEEDTGVEGGGSTACIAVGRQDGSLEVAKYVYTQLVVA